MKKRISIICFIAIICAIVFYSIYPQYDKDKEYVREYISGEEGIKGDVDISFLGDNQAYEIGANREGYAVFKNPDRAWRQMKKDYSKGIKAIQKEYHLLPMSRWNFKKYGEYGWQLTKNTDEEALSQARKVSVFMDLYENSFGN